MRGTKERFTEGQARQLIEALSIREDGSGRKHATWISFAAAVTGNPESASLAGGLKRLFDNRTSRRLEAVWGQDQHPLLDKLPWLAFAVDTLIKQYPEYKPFTPPEIGAAARWEIGFYHIKEIARIRTQDPYATIDLHGMIRENEALQSVKDFRSNQAKKVVLDLEVREDGKDWKNPTSRVVARVIYGETQPSFDRLPTTEAAVFISDIRKDYRKYIIPKFVWAWDQSLERLRYTHPVLARTVEQVRNFGEGVYSRLNSEEINAAMRRQIIFEQLVQIDELRREDPEAEVDLEQMKIAARKLKPRQKRSKPAGFTRSTNGTNITSPTAARFFLNMEERVSRLEVQEANASLI